MKLKLTATRGATPLYEGIHDIRDAASFGNACAELWANLAQRNASTAPNVGALYEALGDNLVPDLRQVQVRFEQADP